jgi:aspartyl-tRNA(Asn)/glutamyl-tRNA(Gln) amidotransferase subunit A
MGNAKLCFMTISAVSGLLASGELSPVELVQAHLDRIAETEPKLNSFITLLEADSLEAARLAEQEIQKSGSRGPLHGVPIGLKDLYYTKGIRTTVGSKIMADFVPDYDAAVVEKFSDSGAVLLGKLQMHEFAFGASSENPHYGPAHNPWKTNRVTGGSSGGSGSSVASGQAMATLGSDTGGSVRIPSGLCGIVGLKPTYGLVSRYGVYPLCWSLDTVGPMTRSVKDAALVMNAISGPDPRDPSSSERNPEDFTRRLGRPIDGLRIGIPKEHYFDVLDAEVEKSVMAAAGVLEGMGATIEQVSIPMLDNVAAISNTIMLAEAAEVHLEHLRDHGDQFDPAVRDRMEPGTIIPAVQYVRAQRARSTYNEQVDRAMATVDVLLAPTCPIGAPKIGDTTVTVAGRTEPKNPTLSRLTRPWNLYGGPATSVPCGLTSEGLPIGLQLAGRPFEDALLLQVADAYEQASGWEGLSGRGQL